MKKLTLLLCLNLALANTFAETNIAGTPLTQQNVTQVMEIQRVADAMSSAVDAKDWDLVRSLMTDDVETSLGSDKTEMTTADKLVAKFKQNLSDKSMTSLHMRTNQRVQFNSADTATMYSAGTIIVTKAPVEKDGDTLLIQNWISYEHGFVKTDKGWKVNRILSKYVASKTTNLPKK